jgi:CubicO group peptidase (beta-lactamase class C family)
MKWMYFKTVIITMALAIAPSLFAASLEEFDGYIEKARVEKKVPGIAVAIVKNDQILFAKGYGVQRNGRPEKIDEHTIFQLASISKAFTSAGLGIEVDRNHLKWDEELILHLPQFALKDSYPSRFATCRDLLAHRTGLPAFGGDLLGKLGFSSEEILYRVRFIEPGSSFRDKAFYSNVGFFIAGELLAKISGKTFEETIKSTLLEPLKMTRSGFSDNLNQSNVASAHAEVEGRIHVIPWDDKRGFPSAGGMTSTAVDMGHWMIMHLNGGLFEGKQIIKSETITEMYLPSMVSEVSFANLPPINKESGFSYGLGWDNYHYNGKMIVEKGGALDGVRTVVTLIPSLKLGIVVLANLNLTVLPEIIRAKFLEMYLGSSGTDIEKMIDEKEGQIVALLGNPSKLTNPLPPRYPLNRYVGVFENELYGRFTITQEYGHFNVSAGPAQWKGTLTHWSNNTFTLRWPTVNSGQQFVTFTFGPEGEAILMSTETLGEFKKIDQEKDKEKERERERENDKEKDKEE